MLGALIGGAIIGSIFSDCVKSRNTSNSRSSSYSRTRSTSSYSSSSRPSYNKPKVITRTVVKKVEDPKLKLQVEFFDTFRALDVDLARMVKEGYKGVAYLEKGLRVSRTNLSLADSLRNIRNYRNHLSHVRAKWRYVPAPTSSLMSDLRYVRNWVNNHYSDAARLAWKGKQAFANNHR